MDPVRAYRTVELFASNPVVNLSCGEDGILQRRAFAVASVQLIPMEERRRIASAVRDAFIVLAHTPLGLCDQRREKPLTGEQLTRSKLHLSNLLGLPLSWSLPTLLQAIELNDEEVAKIQSVRLRDPETIGALEFLVKIAPMDRAVLLQLDEAPLIQLLKCSHHAIYTASHLDLFGVKALLASALERAVPLDELSALIIRLSELPEPLRDKLMQYDYRLLQQLLQRPRQEVSDFVMRLDAMEPPLRAILMRYEYQFLQKLLLRLSELPEPLRDKLMQYDYRLLQQLLQRPRQEVSDFVMRLDAMEPPLRAILMRYEYQFLQKLLQCPQEVIETARHIHRTDIDSVSRWGIHELPQKVFETVFRRLGLYYLTLKTLCDIVPLSETDLEGLLSLLSAIEEHADESADQYVAQHIVNVVQYIITVEGPVRAQRLHYPDSVIIALAMSKLASTDYIDKLKAGDRNDFFRHIMHLPLHEQLRVMSELEACKVLPPSRQRDYIKAIVAIRNMYVRAMLSPFTKIQEMSDEAWLAGVNDIIRLEQTGVSESLCGERLLTCALNALRTPFRGLCELLEQRWLEDTAKTMHEYFVVLQEFSRIPHAYRAQLAVHTYFRNFVRHFGVIGVQRMADKMNKHDRSWADVVMQSVSFGLRFDSSWGVIAPLLEERWKVVLDSKEDVKQFLAAPVVTMKTLIDDPIGCSYMVTAAARDIVIACRLLTKISSESSRGFLIANGMRLTRDLHEFNDLVKCAQKHRMSLWDGMAQWCGISIRSSAPAHLFLLVGNVSWCQYITHDFLSFLRKQTPAIKHRCEQCLQSITQWPESLKPPIPGLSKEAPQEELVDLLVRLNGIASPENMQLIQYEYRFVKKVLQCPKEVIQAVMQMDRVNVELIIKWGICELPQEEFAAVMGRLVQAPPPVWMLIQRWKGWFVHRCGNNVCQHPLFYVAYEKILALNPPADKVLQEESLNIYAILAPRLQVMPDSKGEWMALIAKFLLLDAREKEVMRANRVWRRYLQESPVDDILKAWTLVIRRPHAIDWIYFVRDLKEFIEAPELFDIAQYLSEVRHLPLDELSAEDRERLVVHLQCCQRVNQDFLTFLERQPVELQRACVQGLIRMLLDTLLQNVSFLSVQDLVNLVQFTGDITDLVGIAGVAEGGSLTTTLSYILSLDPVKRDRLLQETPALIVALASCIPPLREALLNVITAHASRLRIGAPLYDFCKCLEKLSPARQAICMAVWPLYLDIVTEGVFQASRESNILQNGTVSDKQVQEVLSAVAALNERSKKFFTRARSVELMYYVMCEWNSRPERVRLALLAGIKDDKSFERLEIITRYWPILSTIDPPDGVIDKIAQFSEWALFVFCFDHLKGQAGFRRRCEMLAKIWASGGVGLEERSTLLKEIFFAEYLEPLLFEPAFAALCESCTGDSRGFTVSIIMDTIPRQEQQAAVQAALTLTQSLDEFEVIVGRLAIIKPSEETIRDLLVLKQSAGVTAEQFLETIEFLQYIPRAQHESILRNPLTSTEIREFYPHKTSELALITWDEVTVRQFEPHLMQLLQVKNQEQMSAFTLVLCGVFIRGDSILVNPNGAFGTALLYRRDMNNIPAQNPFTLFEALPADRFQTFAVTLSYQWDMRLDLDAVVWEANEEIEGRSKITGEQLYEALGRQYITKKRVQAQFARIKAKLEEASQEEKEVVQAISYRSDWQQGLQALENTLCRDPPVDDWYRVSASTDRVPVSIVQFSAAMHYFLTESDAPTLTDIERGLLKFAAGINQCEGGKTAQLDGLYRNLQENFPPLLRSRRVPPREGPELLQFYVAGVYRDIVLQFLRENKALHKVLGSALHNHTHVAQYVINRVGRRLGLLNDEVVFDLNTQPLPAALVAMSSQKLLQIVLDHLSIDLLIVEVQLRMCRDLAEESVLAGRLYETLGSIYTSAGMGRHYYDKTLDTPPEGLAILTPMGVSAVLLRVHLFAKRGDGEERGFTHISRGVNHDGVLI